MKKLGILAVVLVTAAAGCGSGSDSSPGVAATPNAAILRIALTDTPVDDAESVFVVIERVEVLRMGEEGEIRETVMDDPMEVDVLTLQNDVTLVLGEVPLPPGDYTGIRIYLAPTGTPAGPQAPSPHRIVIEGEAFPLFVPSGAQTGLKLQEDFTLTEGVITDLLIDFNVRHSITRLGRNDVYILSPRLRLVPRIASGAVSGTVLEEGTDLPIEGATVSAQQDGEEVASVLTGADGTYRISPLREGTYDLVVTASGHATGIETDVEVTAQQENPDHDFLLATAATGSIAGTAPPGEEFVIVLRFDGHFIAQAGADPVTGGFEFLGVPEGTYALALLESGIEADLEENVVVTGGVETGGIVLTAP